MSAGRRDQSPCGQPLLRSAENADGQKLFGRNLQAVGDVCAGGNGIDLVPSGNEGAVGLMENELVDLAVRASEQHGHVAPAILEALGEPGGCRLVEDRASEQQRPVLGIGEQGLPRSLLLEECP